MDNSMGILNIDIGLYFPYVNQDIVICEFGLLDDDSLDDRVGEEDDEHIFADTVLNHRYRNTNYVTLSKKSGRKMCATGYPVVAPIEELNRHKMLFIRYGVQGDAEMTMFIPISVNLTEKEPVGALEIHMLYWDGEQPEKFGVVCSTLCKDGEGIYRRRYVLGRPVADFKDDVPFSYVDTPYGDAFSVTPVVEIGSQPKDRFSVY